MPAAAQTAAKNESEERMLFALRKHIFYERQLKKQEQEAEVEEERLRKEREAREQRDVMTLDKTREKIQTLEVRHRELQEKKQELFLTLKKLLNEDEVRKKQQQKESQNEMYNLMQQQQQSNPFMPPRQHMQQDRMQLQGSGGNNGGAGLHSNLYQFQENEQGGPGNPMHGRPGGSNAPGGNIANMQMNKRNRSPPSPTPQHGHYYKGGAGGSGSGYTHANIEAIQERSQQEGRRAEVGRAVLWNKPNQYSTSAPGTLFYQTPPMPPNPNVDGSGRGGHPPIIYPYSAIPSQLLRTNYDMTHMSPGQKGPPPSQQQQSMEQQQQHNKGKITLEKLEYPPQPGSDRNMVAAYHHEQERKQHQQQQHQQQQPPPQPGLVYDYFRSIHPSMPPIGQGGGPLPGQPPGKMPPGAPASITRGYMKRGIND